MSIKALWYAACDNETCHQHTHPNGLNDFSSPEELVLEMQKRGWIFRWEHGYFKSYCRQQCADGFDWNQ